MAASATDRLQQVGLSTATTLSAPGYTTGGTGITVGSTTNWPTATGVTFAIDTVTIVNGVEVQDAGSYNEYVGTVATGTTVTNMSWADGNGDRNYSAGSTTRVYIPVSKTRENRIVTWGLVNHDQVGNHKDLTGSNSKTVLGLTDGASTVNNLRSTAAVTGANPILSAEGTDTNVGVTIASKGTGASKFTGVYDAWVSGLPTPNTVTYNGNRSYTCVFNSTDLTGYISNGMRLKLTRTVAAPTQCTSLNGTTQYFSKTSPAGMTFTDDFTVSAWVKVSSYATGIIASRFNGTNGWQLFMLSTGQVYLAGYNGAVGNFSNVGSYQSLPLNKWVHVTAQLDMSTFTATTTTSYVMFDGVDVPASVSRGGTNPTALVQAGDINIGAGNATSFFSGKIAQVAIYNAKVTQATITASINQTLSGSETSLISAYSFNNSINDLSANANNLTANGAAAATNADSPFAQAATAGSLEYGIVTSATFSTNTTLTVQVPEGSAIPTSGGVSAVSYSTQKVPYGFPAQTDKWKVSSLLNIVGPVTSNATYGAFLSNGWSLTVPVGAWDTGWQAGLYSFATIPVGFNLSSTALTGLTTAQAVLASRYQAIVQASSAATTVNTVHIRNNQLLSVATTFLMYSFGATTSAGVDSNGVCEIFAECAYL